MATKNNKKTENKKPRENWNAISGTMRVYGSETDSKRGTFVKYTTSVSRKIKDEWENMYITVRFAKDAGEPENLGENYIEVADAFMSFETFPDKDGRMIKSPVIVIMEWE